MHTGQHLDVADQLLAQEVSTPVSVRVLSFVSSCLPDLNGLAAVVTLLDVDVDGEMGIHISHLVLVALGDTRDQVVDDGLDGSQRSDILAASVVDFNADRLRAVLVLLFGQGESDGDVREVLGEFAWVVLTEPLARNGLAHLVGPRL